MFSEIFYILYISISNIELLKNKKKILNLFIILYYAILITYSKAEYYWSILLYKHCIFD